MNKVDLCNHNSFVTQDCGHVGDVPGLTVWHTLTLWPLVDRVFIALLANICSNLTPGEAITSSNVADQSAPFYSTELYMQ